MKMKGGKILLGFLSFLLLWANPHNGFTQNYPIKPIKVIVPFAAGGSNDLIGRVLIKPLGKELKGNMVVENISAGSTKMAVMEVMKATPDGHTLLYASHGAIMGYYYSGTYETKVWEKMVIRGQSGEMPYGFLETRADSPFKTWADLMNFAKKNPGKLTCGGPAAGGMMNLIALQTAKAAGIKIKYVPFAGGGPSGPSATALLGGHVDYRVCLPADALPNIHSGQTIGLGLSYGKRLPEFPNVPTFKELGILEEVPNVSYDLWGPPNLPPKIASIIAKALEKAVKDPEYVQFCKRMAYQPIFRDARVLKENMNFFEEKVGPQLAAFYKK
jgi:tripartite-type tricarboxylate transporter receptor subunit TctC